MSRMEGRITEQDDSRRSFLALNNCFIKSISDLSENTDRVLVFQVYIFQSFQKTLRLKFISHLSNNLAILIFTWMFPTSFIDQMIWQFNCWIFFWDVFSSGFKPGWGLQWGFLQLHQSGQSGGKYDLIYVDKILNQIIWIMHVDVKIGIVIIPWEVLVLVLLWEFNTNSIGIASFGIVIIP